MNNLGFSRKEASFRILGMTGKPVSFSHIILQLFVLMILGEVWYHTNIIMTLRSQTFLALESFTTSQKPLHTPIFLDNGTQKISKDTCLRQQTQSKTHIGISKSCSSKDLVDLIVEVLMSQIFLLLPRMVKTFWMQMVANVNLNI